MIFFAQIRDSTPQGEQRGGGSVIIDSVVCERAEMHYRDKQMHAG